MNESQKAQYIRTKTDEAQQVALLFSASGKKSTLVPFSNSDLILPKSEILRAFKFIAASWWFSEDPEEVEFSARTFRDTLLVEQYSAGTIDRSEWPETFIKWFTLTMGTTRWLGQYWEDSKCLEYSKVEQQDFTNWIVSRMMSPDDVGFKFTQPDTLPTYVVLQQTMNAIPLQIFEFLYHLEGVRRKGYDAYWIEVHRLLDMQPPPFAPKNGCFPSMALLAILIPLLIRAGYWGANS